MDKKCELYIDMVKLVSDIYKMKKGDYKKTLNKIGNLNKGNDNLFEEWKNILGYVEKLYLKYDKKVNNIDENYIIKYGIDQSYNKLIEIYKQIYKDYNIDIEIMLLIIIPSISIRMRNGIEIIDFNIGSKLNKGILKLINEDNFKDDGCPICFDKLDKLIIISNCCCYKSCLRCFHLIFGKCAICKEQNPVIII